MAAGVTINQTSDIKNVGAPPSALVDDDLLDYLDNEDDATPQATNAALPVAVTDDVTVDNADVYKEPNDAFQNSKLSEDREAAPAVGSRRAQRSR